MPTLVTDPDLLAQLNGSDGSATAPPSGPQRVTDPDLLRRLNVGSDNTPGIVESAVRSIAQGATLGYGDEIKGAGAGLFGLFSGEGFGPAYERTRDADRARNHAAEEAHPWVSTAGKVYGNAAGLVGGLAAAPAGATAAMFGPAAAGLGSRIAKGVASGVGLGGVQGLGEGEGGAADQAKSAAWGAGGGGILGGVAPVAGSLLGRAIAPVAQRLVNRQAPVPGAGNAAADLLVDDLGRAGGRAAVDARLAELGPDARLYHAAPSFEGSAQGLAVRPETAQLIGDDVRSLRAGANTRLRSDLDAAAGPAPVPSQTEAALQDIRTRLQPRYAAEEAAGRPMTPDESYGLWNLAEEHALAQKGGRPAAMLRSVEGAIAPSTRYPGSPPVQRPDDTLQGLMGTRRVIDGHIAAVEADDALRTTGVGARLQQIRQAVDDQIRAANPEIKNLDRAYETFSDALAGHREGLNFLSRDVHPADIAARFEAAPFEQQAAERLGARARIDREVGNTANDLTALKQVVKGDGDWNRAKLATYFGADEAGRIINAVDREAAFQQAAHRLIDNSQTQFRAEAAKRFNPRGEAANADPTIPLAAVAGAAGGPQAAAGNVALGQVVKAFRGANAEALTAADIARNKEIGQFLLQTSGPELRAMLDALERRANLAGVGDAAREKARQTGELLLRSEGNEAAQRSRRVASVISGVDARIGERRTIAVAHLGR